MLNETDTSTQKFLVKIKSSLKKHSRINHSHNDIQSRSLRQVNFTKAFFL